MGYIIIPISLALVILFIQVGIERKHQQRLMTLMVGSFFLRIALFVFVVRTFSFFSHGAVGGDSVAYELWSGYIADYWRRHQLEWVTAEMMPEVGQTALICNAFAFINYLHGSPLIVAYTSLAAMTACLTGLEVFRAARELGASERGANIAMMLVMFSPAFIFHTSDCYKDGFVAYFTVATFTASLSLSRKFSVPKLAYLLLMTVCLWNVRFYMVFMCSLPIVVGLLGFKSKSTIRRVISLFAVGAFVAVAFYGGLARSSAFNRAVETYELSHDSNSTQYNAMGGSGVTFNDGGNPFGSIGLKLAYTVGSPFLWQGGSFGLQVGKLDVLIFYYFIYRAYLAGRRMVSRQREELVQFLVFLVPATVAYATTMANVGLILRQRIPLVVITGIFAALSWPERKPLPASSAAAKKPAALPLRAHGAHL